MADGRLMDGVRKGVCLHHGGRLDGEPRGAWLNVVAGSESVKRSCLEPWLAERSSPNSGWINSTQRSHSSEAPAHGWCTISLRWCLVVCAFGFAPGGSGFVAVGEDRRCSLEPEGFHESQSLGPRGLTLVADPSQFTTLGAAIGRRDRYGVGAAIRARCRSMARVRDQVR